jgi:hypothetical protein
MFQKEIKQYRTFRKLFMTMMSHCNKSLNVKSPYAVIVYQQSPGDHQKETARGETWDGVIVGCMILYHTRAFPGQIWLETSICYSFLIFRFRWKFRETSVNCGPSTSVSFRDVRSLFSYNLPTPVLSSSVLSRFASLIYFCLRFFRSCTVSPSNITTKCNKILPDIFHENWLMCCGIATHSHFCVQGAEINESLIPFQGHATKFWNAFCEAEKKSLMVLWPGIRWRKRVKIKSKQNIATDCS